MSNKINVTIENERARQKSQCFDAFIPALPNRILLGDELTALQCTGECGLGFWRVFDWSNLLWSLHSGTFQGKPDRQSSPHLILIDNLLYLVRIQARKEDTESEG